MTQTLAMIQSLALAFLTLARHINIQEIIWLSAFQGLINAFDMPARQAFLVQMVDGQTGSGQRDRVEFFDGESGPARGAFSGRGG